MLSVVINTKNAETTLKKCLESVRFADEIVVLDMQSKDATVEIAQKHDARVFTTQDRGYVEPVRNEVIGKANGEWILIIDADEELPESARELILKIIEEDWNDGRPVAYRLPRKNIIWNKWIQHSGWWPDYQLRFFQKNKVKWKPEIHSVPDVDGLVADFPEKEEYALVHHNYQSVEQFVLRMNRYSSIQANEVKNSKALLSTEVNQIFFDEWLRRVFQWEAWRDGTHGIALAYMQSLSELTRRLKVWEEVKFESKKNSVDSFRKSIHSVQKSLNYWIADWEVQHAKGFEKIIWQIRRKLKV